MRRRRNGAKVWRQIDKPMVHLKLERVSRRQLQNPEGFKLLDARAVISARWLPDNVTSGEYELLCEVEEPKRTSRPTGFGQE